MTRIIFVILLVSLIAPIARAQQPIIEFGKVEDLKGITKLYIFTEDNRIAHSNIIKAITERRSVSQNLSFVDRPEEAEAILMCSAGNNLNFAPVPILIRTPPEVKSQNRRPVPEYQVVSSDRFVLIPTGKGQARFIDFRDDTMVLFENRPCISFARAFVREHLRANKQ